MSKVTVGLKLSGDLIIEHDGKSVTLNGSQKNLIQVSNGHGITPDVDKAFWEAWRTANKDTKLVKGGFIFANESNEKVKAEAKEKAKNKSGTEKLKPNDSGVETAPKPE